MSFYRLLTLFTVICSIGCGVLKSRDSEKRTDQPSFDLTQLKGYWQVRAVTEVKGEKSERKTPALLLIFKDNTVSVFDFEKKDFPDSNCLKDRTYSATGNTLQLAEVSGCATSSYEIVELSHEVLKIKNAANQEGEIAEITQNCMRMSDEEGVALMAPRPAPSVTQAPTAAPSPEPSLAKSLLEEMDTRVDEALKGLTIQFTKAVTVTDLKGADSFGRAEIPADTEVVNPKFSATEKPGVGKYDVEITPECVLSERVTTAPKFPIYDFELQPSSTLSFRANDQSPLTNTLQGHQLVVQALFTGAFTIDSKTYELTCKNLHLQTDKLGGIRPAFIQQMAEILPSFIVVK